VARRMVLGRLLLGMLAAAFLIQLTVPLARLAVTYKAIEAGLDPTTTGVLATAFALVPMFLVLRFGRINDRGHLGRSAVAGAAIIAVSIAWLFLTPNTLIDLFLSVSVLGIGQTLLYSGLQMVVMIVSTRRHRDTVLGHYVLATSLGGTLAPLFVSAGGSSAPHDVGQLLAVAAAVSAALLLVSTLVLYRRIQRPLRASAAAPRPIRELLRQPGLVWVVVAGSTTATMQDLLLVYVPVLGLARAIGLGEVGLLLSVASVASVASRVSYGVLARRFGRVTLMVGTALIAALALLLMALPLPVAVLFALLPVVGFSLGTGATATLSLALQMAPADSRSISMAVRQFGNRVVLFGFPIGFSALGGLFGVGAIFVGMAAVLGTTSVLAGRSATGLAGKPRSGKGP
jgi:MFS family permease